MAKRLAIISVVLVLLLVPSMLGCAAEEEGVKVVKIGWISALSGPAAASNDMYLTVDDAFRRYTNEENPIPGVRLDFVVYDTRYDPARVPLGYYKFQEEGVVAMVNGDPVASATWRPLMERDEIPMICFAPSNLGLDPPSYQFSCVGNMEQMAYGMLEYIHETWDYEGMGRNPRLANTGWDMSWGKAHGELAEIYAADLDIDFILQEIVAMGTMDMTINARHIGDAGADYVIAVLQPAPFLSLVREAHTKYPGQMTFLHTQLPGKALEDALGPELLEGTINTWPIRSLGDDVPGAQLMRDILTEYAPRIVEAYGDDPGPLLTIPALTLLFESIRMVADEKGVDAISGANIYEAMQRAEVDTDGLWPGTLYYGTDRVPMYGTVLHQYTEGEWVPLEGGKWYGEGWDPFETQ